ncbi:MAG: GNAT family N-acetyltransferase [Rhodobacteraceae bacterium]|nr:GNAT family N-acetyltransferase [Paracoccaceae bacterium]
MDPIRTSRLVLRTLELGDADWITAHISNPGVQRWLTGPPHPFALTDSESWLSDNAGKAFFRAIEVSGEPIGVVSITDDATDLGYWLKEAAWGHGYMSEAAWALVQFHFDAGKGTLTSGWLDGNRASERVLRKLGFTDTGTRMDYSAFYGHEVLAHRVELPRPLHAS